MKLKEHKKHQEKSIAKNLHIPTHKSFSILEIAGISLLGFLILYIVIGKIFDAICEFLRNMQSRFSERIVFHTEVERVNFYKKMRLEVESLLNSNGIDFSVRVEKGKEMDWEKKIETDIDQYWVHYDMESGPLSGCYIRCKITPARGSINMSVFNNDTCKFYLHIGKPGFLFKETINNIWNEKAAA